MKKEQGPYIDIGWSSLKVLLGDRGLELPLERLPGGELSEASRELLRRELRAFLCGGRSLRRAFCAVPAQGVSLRFLSLPSASREETAKILALQLEKEFPLPKEKLAWGYLLKEGGGAEEAHSTTTTLSTPRAARGASPRSPGDPLNGDGAEGNGAPAHQEVTVAAVRREILDDYSRVLADCGIRALFSPGVLASSTLCPRAPGLSSVLDIGRRHSELLNLEDGKPLSVRSLSWGGDSITEAIGRALGIGLADAEQIKVSFRDPAAKVSADPRERAILEGLREGVRLLVKMLRESWPAGQPPGGSAASRQLFLIGGGSRLAGLQRELAGGLSPGVASKLVDVESGPGRSAATLGLRLREGIDDPPRSLYLDHQARGNGWTRSFSGSSVRRWLGAALLLALIAVSLRYAGPFLGMKGLEGRLARARGSLETLPKFDRELDFLSHLSTSRMPFLDGLAVLSASAPRGTRLSVFTINQKGEVTIQGTLGTFQEINEFRGKLTGSRWFTQVVLQEQSPTKDKSRLEFHIAAKLQASPSGSWPPLELPEIPPEPEPSEEEPGPEEIAEPPPAAPPPDPAVPGSPPAVAPSSPEGAKPSAPPAGVVRKSAMSRKNIVGSTGAEGSQQPPLAETTSPPQEVPIEGGSPIVIPEGVEAIEIDSSQIQSMEGK